MSRRAYRWLSFLGDVKALTRGPGAYARRVVRKRANRSFNRSLRKLFKP